MVRSYEKFVLGRYVRDDKMRVDVKRGAPSSLCPFVPSTASLLAFKSHTHTTIPLSQTRLAHPMHWSGCRVATCLYSFLTCICRFGLLSILFRHTTNTGSSVMSSSPEEGSGSAPSHHELKKRFSIWSNVLLEQELEQKMQSMTAKQKKKHKHVQKQNRGIEDYLDDIPSGKLRPSRVGRVVKPGSKKATRKMGKKTQKNKNKKKKLRKKQMSETTAKTPAVKMDVS